jgi:4-diphosphocytidyl-2-C-methyl-D-erythritol kinase
MQSCEVVNHGQVLTMGGPAARIEAQAKLNLYLRVLTREESGYHSIETIFHRIDLADDIQIRLNRERKRTVDVTGAEVGPMESNLAYRAAVAYQEYVGWPRGFTIEIEKHIAPGAGLGGGSADAAAVLRTFDSLNRHPIGQLGLLMLATKLGADVPFLVSPEIMALAWGRGERMLGCSPLPRRDVLLVRPDFRVSSADAYGWLDEERPSEGDMLRHSASDLLLISDETLTNWENVTNLSRNDFIPPVSMRHPEIRTFLDTLAKTGAFLCSMTGSGSTLFGIYESLPDDSALDVFNGAATIATRTSDQVVQPTRIG